MSRGPVGHGRPGWPRWDNCWGWPAGDSAHCVTLKGLLRLGGTLTEFEGDEDAGRVVVLGHAVDVEAVLQVGSLPEGRVGHGYPRLLWVGWVPPEALHRRGQEVVHVVEVVHAPGLLSRPVAPVGRGVPVQHRPSQTGWMSGAT